jgi:hypothetical protein
MEGENRMKRTRLLPTFMIPPISLAGILFWSGAVYAQTPAQDITCENGNGEYSTEFFTGTTVSVDPMRQGSFAERACEAKLIWKREEIPVASDVGKVGIDVLGADLGFGKPVVAFQIDKSGAGSNLTYQIYSLSKPPHLLYTITGGNTYRAADTDMDGRIEIWTDDAAAANNFEGVPGADLDFPPTVVLRFEKGRLVDVGSEFRSFYDAQIVKLRSQVSEGDLARFKQSDGQLSATSSRPDQDLHALVRTKISVLEIVWAYLYSDREKEAWSALNEMWPAQDLDRIRAAISTVHRRGILHNLDRSGGPPHHRDHVKIYDAVETAVVADYDPRGGAPETEPPVIQPKSILLRRPPPSSDESIPSTDETIELVVDVAGKVHSAKIVKGVDKPLVEASASWQFIPAFSDGRPVACRFRLSVWTLK